MNELWSYSTTIREANRIVDFLETAAKLNGTVWDKNNQRKFQILLIQDRKYLNGDSAQVYNKLNTDQIKILKDKEHQMTYEEAEGIFDAKEYEDPSMRGRQSMAPLVKLGLMYHKEEEFKDKIYLSPLGKMVLSNEISIEDFFFDSLIKFQYPNPDFDSNKNYNCKPFICLMRLIRKVNELCIEKGWKPKGLHRIEFGVFGLSITNYEDIDSIAKKVIEFREKYIKLKSQKEKDVFIKQYVDSYLKDFKNPIKNIYEYSDNLIRYLRMTKYIIVRGKYDYIYFDLEPSREIEITSILEKDDGRAKTISQEEWQKYICNYGTYELPFRTVSKLKEVYAELENELSSLSKETKSVLPSIPQYSGQILADEKTIANMRRIKTHLQNEKIKQEYQKDTSRIDEVIDIFNALRLRKKEKLVYSPSLELEKWSNVALNILDDCVDIKPNTKVGDDNEPINTAPGKVPDIECFYDDFDAICEVTMLTGRDQWYNEGAPVQRHLRDFEKNSNKDCYCLFVAPSIHTDTLSTFFNAVKYGYDGKKQRFIPIRIDQFESILDTVKKIKEAGRTFTHDNLLSFYKECNNLNEIDGFSAWQEHINSSLTKWTDNLLTA